MQVMQSKYVCMHPWAISQFVECYLWVADILYNSQLLVVSANNVLCTAQKIIVLTY